MLSVEVEEPLDRRLANASSGVSSARLATHSGWASATVLMNGLQLVALATRRAKFCLPGASRGEISTLRSTPK